MPVFPSFPVNPPGSGSQTGQRTCQHANDGEHEEDCKQQYDGDSEVCRGLTNPAARARCWASAAERYGACLAKRPIPPLVTN